MVEMAKPWKNPETGTYYLRRQIPAAIRSAFSGKQLHKVALGTNDAKQAAVLFLQANAELEIRFEEARARLKATGSPLPSSRDRAEEMIGGCFNGAASAPGGLDGAGRLLLARLELDRGLWNETETGCSAVPPSSGAKWQELSDNAAQFRTHQGTRRHLSDQMPGAIWAWDDELFGAGARGRQLERLSARIAHHHGLDPAELPTELADVLTAYLDALPVGVTPTRKLREKVGRLRPDMRLMGLCDDWQIALAPSLQSASEYPSRTSGPWTPARAGRR